MIQTDPEIQTEPETDIWTPVRRKVRWLFLFALVWLAAALTVLLVTGRINPSAVSAAWNFSFTVLAVAVIAIYSVAVMYKVFFRKAKSVLTEPWGEVVNVPEELRGPEPCGRYMSSPSPSSPPIQGGGSKGKNSVIASEAKQSNLLNPSLGKPWDEAAASLTPSPIEGEGRGEGGISSASTDMLAIHDIAKKHGWAVTVFRDSGAQRQALIDMNLGAQMRVRVEAEMAALTKAAGGLH